MANTKIPVELSSTPGIVDNSNATAITIDSSENVGIGTTSPDAVLTTVNSGALTLDSNDGDHSGFGLLIEPSTITANTVNSAIGFAQSTGRKYAAIGMQTYADVDQAGLNFYVQSTASGSSAQLSEAMRIDSSGNVGIGVTNPSDYYATDLVVSSGSEKGITIAGTSTSVANYLAFADGASGTSRYSGYVGYSHANDDLALRSADYITLRSGGGTERMRIDSAGNVLINQTSSNLTYGKLQVSAGGETAGHGGIVGFFDTDGSVASSNLIQLLSFSGDTDATGGQFIRFRDSNSVMGSVSAASGTTVAYNTSSDRRMKENIVDASSQLDVINNIQVREFDWKNNGHHEVGMIAQELNDVIPNVVQEGGNDVTEQPWGVDYGKLTPYLIKAIQEQQAQIDALQSEINELKSS